MSENQKEQLDEFLALSSILEPETLKTFEEPDGSCNVKLMVRLDSSETIEIRVNGPTANNRCKSAKIKNLPPIHICMKLPADYPSNLAPRVTAVAASWLDKKLTDIILQRLTEISGENYGLPVLYLYYQFFKDEFWHLIPNPFDLNQLSGTKTNCTKQKVKKSTGYCGTDSPTHKTANFHCADQLFCSLVDYDCFRMKQQFDESTFTCQICYLDNYGSSGVKFSPCCHVFCKACCKNFFELHIKDGSLDSLKCLADKCQTLAHPGIIEKVVGEDLFQRYDRLALTKSLDLMQDVVVCPKLDCASFVVKDDQYNNMAMCPQCYFAFCTLCKKVYHGVAQCELISGDITAVLEEYSAGDKEVKMKLESRYGKNTIRRLMEEASCTKWMSDNCKQCPACRTQIEKKDGCNKISCTKCGAYFCWLCMRHLNSTDPYKHFTDPDSPCFNLLFRGMAVEEPDMESGDEN